MAYFDGDCEFQAAGTTFREKLGFPLRDQRMLGVHTMACMSSQGNVESRELAGRLQAHSRLSSSNFELLRGVSQLCLGLVVCEHWCSQHGLQGMLFIDMPFR